MRRVRIAAAALSTLTAMLTLLIGSATTASGPPQLSTTTTTAVSGPVVTAVVSVPGSSVPGSSGVEVVVAIPCAWFDVGATQDFVDRLNRTLEVVAERIAPINGYVGMVPLRYYVRNGVLHRAGDVPGVWEKQQRADCGGATHPDGVVTGDRRWVVSLPPDPASLLPGAIAMASRVIEAPVGAFSPAVEGVVQLGMWLAVEDVGPYSVVARLPETGPASVWARTTATLVETRFEFGNGVSVTCEGAGTAIPESAKDEVGEGPCGYTFTDFVGDTSIVITSSWSIGWELSDGRTGIEPDWVVVSGEPIPYSVVEIFTVGRR